MFAVIAAWMLFPTLSLVVFLALSLYHFGTGDATALYTSTAVVKVTEFVSRGGIVLTFPAAFHSSEVQMLFSYLVPESSAVKIITVLTESTPLVAVCFIICTITSFYEFMRRKKTLDLLRAIELLSLGSLFTLLPALLSFTIYFSFLHSVRHMLKVASDGTTVSLIQGLLGAFRKSLPVTVATMVLGGMVYFLDGKLALDISKTVQIVFIGIASMTYPHVLVITLAARSQPVMNAIGAKAGILFASQPTDSKA
jgi:Brp/Blh family beta-carotene 15,15'-monooxygenase